MEFSKFKSHLQSHVSSLLKRNTTLFVTNVDKNKLWETYLDSFPAGTNEVFRKRREFDCACCRHFIKSFGNVVAIEDNKVVSIWDFKTNDTTYQPVLNALSALIKSSSVRDVFVTKEYGFGTDKNHEQREDGSVHTWEHFRIDLPKQFITKSSKTEASLMSVYNSTRNVLKRSLEEISKDAVDTILDLISQNSLYKGEEWKDVLSKFLELHQAYHKLSAEEKENYCWKTSVEVGAVVGKIRNHSIGVLLMDITANEDLNNAVKKYEAIVAPTNYKRPKAIFTKKMINAAEKTLTDLGLLESLGRRYALIDDITVNNVLFANRDSLKQMSGDVFAELEKKATTSAKKFDRVEEVPIDNFITDILPRLTDIEVMFENKHIPNLVSVIAPKVKEAPTLFKWNNGFSWAYNGNITDSMKERVKALGGRVDGVFRFTHSWNELEPNQSLMDLHVFLPTHNNHKDGIHDYYGNNERVGWNNRKHIKTGGSQDVDYVNQAPIGYVPIENITFPDIKKMPEGKYICKIHNWSFRNSGGRGKAEIEIANNLYQYIYPKTKHKEWITVAEVTLKNYEFTINHKLKESQESRQIWNLNTNNFYPVAVCMFSPNYWDSQTGIGNKHYFFILKECKNDTQPNGFFNEFLQEKLMEHKRVFEALGSNMKVDPSEEQLSGVGFSSTQRNKLVCKIKGVSVNRTIKLIF